MTEQISLEPDEINLIDKILEKHKVELSTQDIMGKDFWNEVKIHICDKGGVNYYIVVD